MNMTRVQNQTDTGGDDPFSSLRTGCCSGFQLDKMAYLSVRGEPLPDLPCKNDACEAQLADAIAAQKAAAFMPIPRQLQATRGRKRWHVWLPALVPAAMGLMLWFVMPHDAPHPDPRASQESGSGLRSKGTMTPAITILRDGATITKDAPLTALPLLKVGDTLQLRIIGAKEGALIEIADAKSQPLYSGPVDERGWLPQGFRVTRDPNPQAFRLRLCEGPSSRCKETQFIVRVEVSP
jgi:hypothetical protein